ncbi:translation initiation factor IF-2, partial [Anaerostipes hadrus]|nr:translation initiation factor IF-2 [Anaerostipes hadrus]
DAASAEKVDLRLYRVIYNAIEDIEACMKCMLDPEFGEKVTGHAEVRQIFKASGVGTIAGSYVLDGPIQRDSSARIIRYCIVVHEGKLASIQRGKDAVNE